MFRKLNFVGPLQALLGAQVFFTQFSQMETAGAETITGISHLRVAGGVS